MLGASTTLTTPGAAPSTTSTAAMATEVVVITAEAVVDVVPVLEVLDVLVGRHDIMYVFCIFIILHDSHDISLYDF